MAAALAFAHAPVAPATATTHLSQQPSELDVAVLLDVALHADTIAHFIALWSGIAELCTEEDTHSNALLARNRWLALRPVPGSLARPAVERPRPAAAVVPVALEQAAPAAAATPQVDPWIEQVRSYTAREVDVALADEVGAAF